MELPLEPAVTLAREEPDRLAGHSLDEWNAAYERVESYFCALHLRNKLLLGQLVSRVLDRAMQRAALERGRSASELAAEEMHRLVSDWFTTVLDAPLDSQLSERGRLALLLADMPQRWQAQFLAPPPWPDEFVRSMRESFLRAGPDFQRAQMTPRPIDLGPIAVLTNAGNFPYFRAIAVWTAFAALLVLIFKSTH